jgi:hypothetical protein
MKDRDHDEARMTRGLTNDTSLRSPGRRTLVDEAYAPSGRPTDPTIRRQEDPLASTRVELADLVQDVEVVRRNVDPDGAGADGVAQPGRYTNRLRRLSARLDALRTTIENSGNAGLRAELAAAQDQLVAAYQTLAVYHADQTLQAWDGASDEDRGAQRDQYQREAGMGGNSNADWCGMFANAQYRDAGFHGALNMTFNSTFHAQEFFIYGSGSSNSPDLVAPHGTEPRRPVQEYHRQRGSLRSWLEREAIGHDLRPGDIVTIDWVGPNDTNDGESNLRNRVDHVSIVRSYNAATGVLVTIDGNAFGVRKPGAEQPAWDSLGDRDYTTLSGDAEATDVSTSRYEREAASSGPTGDQNTGPAFDRNGMLGTQDVWREMTLYGRGRPSLVDFEPDHVYFNQIDDNAANDRQVSEVGRPEGPIQRREHGPVATADPTTAFDAATSSGAGEVPYRDEMQRALGADFSSVRAYVGRDLRSLGALAATRGEDVAFSSSTPDRETVAHELTHVLQARDGRASAGSTVSDPGDATEHEARSTAASIVRGDTAMPAIANGSSTAAIQRQEDPQQPPAVQPDANDGHGSGRLAWDEYFGISMALPSGGTANSVREIYELALLRHLPALLPELCAGYELPPREGGGVGLARQRHDAVTTLGEAIHTHVRELLRDGDRETAEDIRVRVFTAHQYAIVDALSVERSPRYDSTDTETFCNIYAYDVVTAMGAYVPRIWWKPDAIAAIQAGAEVVSPTDYEARAGENVVTANETFTTQVNANALMEWMRDWGVPAFGWEIVETAEAAQAEANGGNIVIILARHAVAEESGHVSVILAESAQHRAPTETSNDAYVPLQSQAGASNFSYNDTESAVGTAGRRAWWAESIYADAGFFVYRGTLGSEYAIDRPDMIGTRLPPPAEPEAGPS